MVATLARKRKARDINLLAFAQKAQELEEDWSRFIQIQLTTETIDLAQNLARDMALRSADAIHPGSALIERSISKDREALVNDVQRALLQRSLH